jgi:hypothetical protein
MNCLLNLHNYVILRQSPILCVRYRLLKEISAGDVLAASVVLPVAVVFFVASSLSETTVILSGALQ